MNFHPLSKTRNTLKSFLLLLIATLTLAGPVFSTPLDDYVQKPDPAFSYGDEPVKVVEGDGFTLNVYKMVSQNWLTSEDVDRTEWWHWVLVVIPDEVKGKNAMLFIDGGSNRGDDPPTSAGPMAQIAVQTKTVVVDVKQIPNQPLKFTGEQMEKYKGKGRSEDALIAYGWDKFLVNQDPIWLARLPMTKAVVGAMDLVQKERPDIEGFFVAGGSKRGWTTWTVAAVDKRVVGISPAVIDVLNVAKTLDNHHAAYGFWAPAIGNYEEMDILSRIHTPEFKKLEEIVDPLSYVDRLTMPKYIINSAGDQFFPVDSWKFYFDKLKGEKYLRYMPNTDHGLGLEAYFNMASFFHAVLNDTPRPKFDWKLNPDGQFEVQCETEPTNVLLWKATNPKGRDFRLENIGPVYKSESVKGENGLYKTSVEAPEEGWTAFFLELEFPNPDFAAPFKFTTGINVLPDTLPFGPTETKP